MAFARNSSGRQIATEITSKIKFSDFGKKAPLYKADKDGTDHVVIAVPRGRHESSGFVPKSHPPNRGPWSAKTHVAETCFLNVSHQN